LTILSRGYGNCRITSTAVQNVWWVQYFNSQDKNILNTIEIGAIPAVAAAAHEDVQDSAERLSEILEAYL
ncbi:MAG: hydrogenase expression/formation protein, partial [Candidatus Thiodiazotropha taylori]|nr:hydrogenase expression/formation protein [Candidatus Thiodiazotropha taylori]